MYRRFEGLMMALNYRQTQKKRAEQIRRMSFSVRHPAMTTD